MLPAIRKLRLESVSRQFLHHQTFARLGCAPLASSHFFRLRSRSSLNPLDRGADPTFIKPRSQAVEHVDSYCAGAVPAGGVAAGFSPVRRPWRRSWRPCRRSLRWVRRPCRRCIPWVPVAAAGAAAGAAASCASASSGSSADDSVKPSAAPSPSRLVRLPRCRRLELRTVISRLGRLRLWFLTRSSLVASLMAAVASLMAMGAPPLPPLHSVGSGGPAGAAAGAAASSASASNGSSADDSVKPNAAPSQAERALFGARSFPSWLLLSFPASLLLTIVLMRSAVGRTPAIGRRPETQSDFALRLERPSCRISLPARDNAESPGLAIVAPANTTTKLRLN